MSDAAERDPDEQEDTGEDAPEEGTASRDRDLLGNSRSPIRRKLADLASAVWRGYEDQSDRSDSQLDYWDCFNCVTNGNQYYNGIAQIYWPIIHDAITARATRFINQLFPHTGRYVEVISADGAKPAALVGLLEHYIRSQRFKTQVLKPLCRTGDIEGQYNLYLDWAEVRRQLVSRETHGTIVDGIEADDEEIDDITEEEVILGAPVFEVLHDCDVLVLPATVDTIEEALSVGGSVTICRRWTKTMIDQMVDEGQIREAEAKTIKNEMGKIETGGSRDAEKHLAEHVGIHAKGGMATVWEVWTMLPLDKSGGYSEKGEPRLCRVFFGPHRMPLGAKRNPYWNDRCPLLSCPVEKEAGVFKGPSLIAPIASLQYEANDAVNEGADAATLSAAPIVTRDTAAYNGPLIYNVGAVWDIPPKSVKLLTFPDLTPRAQTRVQMAIEQIFQTLGVNPSMLPQQTRSSKPNQAMIAQEQQVDLLTTAEAVSVLEEGILTPAMGWTVDLDYQFRDRALLVRQFGDMGIMAEMEEVAPLQNRNGFSFLWRGGEQVKQSAMMQQQGTAWVNVLRGLRAELQAEGYQLHLGPLIEAGTQNVFGSFLGSRVLIDQRHQLTVPPDLEDDMMLGGFERAVHPFDNDPEHLQAHMISLRETGDPHGTIRAHMQKHEQSMQMKMAASMQRATAQQGLPAPGGGGGGPGQPQPGAAPAGPHAVKRPPGAVHPDRGPASGVIEMPRRM